MAKHYMNPQIGRHMGDMAEGEGEEDKETSRSSPPPHIHVHSHKRGVTVHVMHHDGRHEKHEHEHGDAEGIAEHIHRHHGGTAFAGRETPGEEAAEENA